MANPDETGRSEGPERGPEPGDGAVVHDSSGNADFDGLPGDVLPPKRDDEERRQFPPERAADCEGGYVGDANRGERAIMATKATGRRKALKDPKGGLTAAGRAHFRK